MMTDTQYQFSTNQSLVGTDGTNIVSTNIVDLLGTGVGTAPAAIIGLPSTGLFGADMGVGEHVMELLVVIGTSLATGNAAKLNVAFQAAPDTATTHVEGTYQTLVETGPLTIAQTASGLVVARFKFPPSIPANLSPRYLRLLYQPGSGAHFTAGTIALATVTPARDDQANRFAARNYSVA